MTKVKFFQKCRPKVTVKVTVSSTLVSLKKFYYLKLHAKYEVSISYGSKVMAQIKVFRYVGKRSLSRPLGKSCWHDLKGLITRNVHVKYESSTSNCSKVMAKVNIFRNVRQRSRSRSLGHQPRCHLTGFY